MTISANNKEIIPLPEIDNSDFLEIVKEHRAEMEKAFMIPHKYLMGEPPKTLTGMQLKHLICNQQD